MLYMLKCFLFFCGSKSLVNPIPCDWDLRWHEIFQNWTFSLQHFAQMIFNAALYMQNGVRDSTENSDIEHMLLSYLEVNYKGELIKFVRVERENNTFRLRGLSNRLRSFPLLPQPPPSSHWTGKRHKAETASIRSASTGQEVTQRKIRKFG